MAEAGENESTAKDRALSKGERIPRKSIPNKYTSLLPPRLIRGFTTATCNKAAHAAPDATGERHSRASPCSDTRRRNGGPAAAKQQQRSSSTSKAAPAPAKQQQHQKQHQQRSSSSSRAVAAAAAGGLNVYRFEAHAEQGENREGMMGVKRIGFDDS
ncbi:hypothetical protein ACSSS7_002394 [Eimeria intestinalis]